ncbi:MAG: AzlD domain-containing protein [Desulfococcaceae bacterium]
MNWPDAEFLLLVGGMGLATYLPRWAPLLFLSERKLPDWLVEWLDLIPAAILSALVAPALVVSGDPRQLDWLRPELAAAVPTFWFARKTRSLAGAVVLGMALFWLLERVAGG